MTRVAIIVLNWNGSSDTIECVKSLLAQSEENVDIIIVDNNSSDDSVVKLKSFMKDGALKQVTLLENGINSGFGGGINSGIRYALRNNYKYIGALNPDAVAEKDWVREILKQFDDNSSVGAATGLLLTQDGSIVDSSGDFYTLWGLPAPRNRDQPRDKAPKAAGVVFGATGGGVIYSAEALKIVGLFDERFFMYYEDVDLSFRLQLAGYTVRYTPQAVAYHKRGASSDTVPGLAVYNTFKNLPLLFIKNVPARLLLSMWPRYALMYGLIMISALFKGNGAAALRGFIASVRLTPNALRERRKIQSSRKVPASYIRNIILKTVPEDQIGMKKIRLLLESHR